MDTVDMFSQGLVKYELKLYCVLMVRNHEMRQQLYCSGDIYTGQWDHHQKHGKGKFEWISGWWYNLPLGMACYSDNLCHCVNIGDVYEGDW